SREELVSAIVEYIDYYRNDRPQRGLGILSPMEYHDMLMAA
ncbi:IS3 family transposase, partial [Blautia obeum]